jgi:iron complex outermembrane receptor protein
MTRTFAPAFAALACLAAPSQGQEEVITVTGSRSPEALGASAAPVAVIGEAELTLISAQQMSEILNRAPGVHIHRGNGAEHLTSIRSPVLSGGAGAGSFLYLEDGIPLRSAGFANINGLFEAADELAGRVEVIRGPGAAVYGSNALHGLVNVISPDPATAGRLAGIEAGSYGRLAGRAYAGGTTDHGAGFAGIAFRSEDGWRDDASLRRFAAQGRYDWTTGATEWSARAALINLEQETATFVQGFESYRDTALSRRNANPEAFRDARALRAALHADHRISDTLRAQGAVYGRTNSMDFRLHFLPSRALEFTGHDSLGFQSALVWESGGTRLMGGADGEATRGYLIEDQTLESFGEFPQGIHYDYTVKALTGAVFVQGRHALTGRLSVEGGVRAETVRYDYENRTDDGVTGRFLRLPGRTDDFSTLAPHAGLTFQASDTLQLFARAARGVRAPQTDELYRLQLGQEIDGISPEQLDSLEAGARLALPGGGRIEVVGFTMEKTNVFFRDADGINVTDGVTTHDGVEIEAVIPLHDTLTLSGSGTWAIHEYGFDRPVGQGFESITSGDRVDTAPEWLWNLRALWTPTPATRLEAEWLHVGEYFADAANEAVYAGHDLLNLRGSWEVREGLEVFGSVRNALNTRYAERADFAFGNFRYFPGEPRTFSVGVRVRG